MADPQDVAFMQRALFLAERGRGTTTPNPVVGAVVVSADGIVVGHGAHRVAGGPHAEVFALDAAGASARGGTLYCTLEPCSHTGRTGPCAARVAEAGIARVVAAMEDPNPKVSGQGFEFLRARGVRVDRDVERAAAARLNAPFVTWVTRQRPHITLKVAMSRDGFVGSSDARVRLTGLKIDRLMHRERAEVDAIAVGSNTILIDDPLLTARLAYRERPLVRVVFDRRGRVSPGARLFQTLDAGPVIILVGADVQESANSRAVRAAGGEVMALPDADSIDGAMRALARRDVLSVLVEGGPALHRGFWDAGVVDRVQVIETPIELGVGVPAFVPDRSGQQVAVRSCGADTLVEWDVHRTD